MEGIIFRGLSLAGIYFLISFGFTFLYGVGGFPNLAIGPIGLAGAYLTATMLRSSNTVWSALLGGVGLSIVLGVIIQRFLVEPLYMAVRGGDRGRIFVIYGTFGLTLLAPAIMLTILRSTMVNVRLPSLGVVKIMRATITGYEILSVILALLIFGLAHYILTKTRAGNRVRAVTQNAPLAGFLGIKVRSIYLVTAAIASVTAYVGALLWGEIFSLELGSGMMFTLYGLIVAVMGGLGSIYGAVLVSLILGVTISATSFMVGGVYEHIVTTFILIIVLIVAPRGLVPTRREI